MNTESLSMPGFTKSDRFSAAYPGVGFGLTLIADCRNPVNPSGFDQYKRKRLRRMRKRETLAQIKERINTYARHFQLFGHPCPLPEHLRRTVNSGFPRYNLMVDAHFMAEMCAGILVAVTDYDRFDGALTLDLADAGETCRGMGGRGLSTKEGEIVLRDAKEIVCVLCQGADEKTKVSDHTRNVLFYTYAVPGINECFLEDGLKLAAEVMTEFGEGKIVGAEVF